MDRKGDEKAVGMGRDWAEQGVRLGWEDEREDAP